jgi:hypothetical protein
MKYASVKGSSQTYDQKQRLVLLPKETRSSDEPSSYLPICLLYTAGKVLERILCDRLQETIAKAGNLDEHQYGFRKRCSTMDVIKSVLDITERAVTIHKGLRGTKKYCAIVTLDVKNAFNRANWNCKMNALRQFGAPKYLIKMVASNFNHRVLKYNISEGVMSYVVTGGVPHGAVLSPTFQSRDGRWRSPIIVTRRNMKKDQESKEDICWSTDFPGPHRGADAEIRRR